MKNSKSPERIIIPSPTIDNEGTIQSVNTKRKKPTFMTQSKKSTAEELLMQQHHELINYIGGLETKVQKIIQSHDSQFLLAYKNHLNRVRQQMQELKIKTSKQANSLSSQSQRIQTLQKELIIFREESLKLFDKMTEKEKQIDVLKMKVYQLETQQKFSKRTIADLMKRNKYLEALVQQFDLNKTQFQTNTDNHQSTKKTNISFLEVNSLKKYSSQHKKTPKIVGKTDYSYFYKNNNTINNNQTKNDSRHTTSGFRSKRNSITIQNHPSKSINDYFAKNLASSFRQS